MSEVLIVDDESPVRDLLSRWLTPAGYAVREAGNAPDALAIVDSGGIGVVFCDRALPGHDGVWLIDQLRKQHPDVAIVLATADDSLPTRISLQDGVVGYLVKPFTPELVLNAVSDAMAWHRVAAKQRAKPAEPGGNPVETWLRGRAGDPARKHEL